MIFLLKWLWDLLWKEPLHWHFKIVQEMVRRLKFDYLTNFSSVIFAYFTVKPKEKVCPIHCWQQMKLGELFKYEVDVVTLEDLMLWSKAKFNALFSSAHDVNVYYVKDLSKYDKRVRICDDEALRLYLPLVSYDRESFLVVSVDKESPIKLPCIDVISAKQPTAMSPLSSTSSGREAVHTNFRERVLTRDTRCVFCGHNDVTHLEAAHIYDVHRAKGMSIGDDHLQQYMITNIYDTTNGLTLCIECYEVYDALYCCVKVASDGEGVTATHTIAVADAVKSHPYYAEKWSRLEGASVIMPTTPLLVTVWPPAAVFRFREKVYDEHTLERHTLVESPPYECDKCGMRVKTEARLAKHMRGLYG